MKDSIICMTDRFSVKGGYALKYDIVLFDADGTLLDFAKSEREAVMEALSAMDVELVCGMLEEYSRINDSFWKMLERGEIEKKELFYRRFEVFFEKYGIKKDPHKMADTYMRILSEKGYLLDGAFELCKELSGKVRMYIVTNGTEFIQRGRQKRSGISQFFEGVFISDCIGFEKPRIEFFEYVENSIENFSKERTLIVGDSLTSDIAGGINFGIDTCWYDPKGKTAPAEMADKITYIVSDFSEVKNIIMQGDTE